MTKTSGDKPRRFSALDQSVLYGLGLFLVLLAYESWCQVAFFSAKVPKVITPLFNDGLSRCSSDIIRFFFTLFFLYMFTGIASGVFAHVMARGLVKESRWFRPAFFLELILIPAYLTATMALIHPQFFAIKPFYNIVPVFWITAHTKPWMFHLALALYFLVHGAFLVLRYRQWARERARPIMAATAGALVAALLIAVIEWPPGLGRGPVVHDPEHPHLFFFCIDCLRLDRFQRKGYFRNITPNLDAFFNDSVVFENVFSPLAKTYPSWVSFLTSTGLLTHGVRWAMPAKERRWVKLPTMVQVLNRGGWNTTFYTDDSRFSYLEDWTGFKEIKQPEPGFMNFFAEHTYYYLLVGKLANTRIGNFLFPMTKYNHALTFTYSPRIFYEDYMSHIGREVRKGPLASFSHNVCIHYPGAAPWPYYSLFTDPDYRGDNKYLYKVFFLSDANREQMLVPADSNEHYQQLYDGMVKMMDEKFGMFVQTLKELGIYDESMIVVFSDHGEHFSERHPAYSHIPPMHGILLNDDFQNRCVLAIKFPEKLKGKIKVWDVPELARLDDIAPTALDALGRERPGTFEGVSFWPRIQGIAPPPDLTAYMETDLAAGFLLEPGGMALKAAYTELYALDPGRRTIGVIEDFSPAIIYTKSRAIRTNQWKLIRIPLAQGTAYRLYDPVVDPHHEHELSQEQPAAFESMLHQMAPYLKPDIDILKKSPGEMGVREIKPAP